MKKYQFTWGRNYEKKADNFFEKIIKANSIDEACLKFKNRMSKNLQWVDYEVKCNGEFIDIRNNELLREYL